MISLCYLRCSAPNTYLHPRYGDRFRSIKNIAVLPFANKTKKIDAGLIVTYIFISQLHNNSRYKVANLGDVKEILLDRLIRIKDTIDFNTAKILGEKLGVQALIIGEVLKFKERQDEDKKNIPEVAISVHLLHIKSGKILWTCQHERNGEDYKIIFDLGQEGSIIRLAQKVISEMLETLIKKPKHKKE